MTTVISLGGSVIAPKEPNIKFLKDFVQRIRKYLNGNPDRKIILVIGGGGPAREWQMACQNILRSPSPDSLDWIGIMATRLNAELVKAIFEGDCPHDVVIEPETVTVFTGKILVAAGWKPGFSTDYDAVILAKKFDADMLINLSNTTGVFSEDPKKNPDAKKIESLDWYDFLKLVGTIWVPGSNYPFDPIAAKKASESRLKVICALGSDLDNFENILAGKQFNATIIGPN